MSLARHGLIWLATTVWKAARVSVLKHERAQAKHHAMLNTGLGKRSSEMTHAHPQHHRKSEGQGRLNDDSVDRTYTKHGSRVPKVGQDIQNQELKHDKHI